MDDREQDKKAAANAALTYVEENQLLGVGTGSTVNYFIEALAASALRITGAVPSSRATAAQLKQHGIQVVDPTSSGPIPVYIDGADEVNPHLQLIKGGGGALTGEKIIAAQSKQFVCIVDGAKQVKVLGKFPLAIEVIPIARSYVARELVKIGWRPCVSPTFYQ